VYLAEEQIVSVEGRHRRTRLAKTDRPTFFIVEVDDKRYGVELTSKFDKDNLSFTVKVDGKQYKINLSQNKNESTTVQVDGRSFTIKREKANEKIPKAEFVPMVSMKETMAKLPLGEGAIIAAMPGKVVAIKVKKEDKVKTGDVLCILEAMKMENEILAPKAGTVQEINISEGITVNKGQVLIILK
jgi:biotin carboxyl carrier protein